MGQKDRLTALWTRGRSQDWWLIRQVSGVAGGCGREHVGLVRPLKLGEAAGLADWGGEEVTSVLDLNFQGQWGLPSGCVPKTQEF